MERLFVEIKYNNEGNLEEISAVIFCSSSR